MPAFCEQVIGEYKKFMLLCCVLPQGASPSQQVDAVWHLHLTYTRSYWTHFCRNTLGKDIHHHPSGRHMARTGKNRLDEFGAVVPVVSLLFALYFWSRRKEVDEHVGNVA